MLRRVCPGSIGWLLKSDMTLAWRDMRGTFRSLDRKSLCALALVVLVVMHAAAWPVAVGFTGHSGSSLHADGREAEAAPLLAFVLLLMLAQTLNGVTKLLYSRGDLDLMLSSPVPPERVFLVRSLAVAGGALASAAIFVVPLADAGLLTGQVRFLALYPTLVGCALLAATFGILIALGLFRTIGPKATRLAAQIVATFIGAGFMLGLQLHQLLPALSVSGVLAAIHAAPFNLGAVLLLPLHAGLGEPLPLVVWVLGSAALFWIVTRTLGRGFARSVQAGASVAWGPRGGARRGGRAAEFRLASGVRATLRLKEWRLIARDPWVVSQMLLQILYMTPMAALLWSGAGSAPFALAPMIVVIGFQVASSLTWLCLSAEDAPELLATAPVSPSALRRCKLEAVGIVTLGIIALPLAWLAVLSPRAAAVTLGLALLGLANAVMLQLWQGKPGRRSAFAARHRESKLVALLEMALSMLWGIATALLVLPSAWAVAPLALTGMILLFCRPRQRREPADEPEPQAPSGKAAKRVGPRPCSVEDSLPRRG